MACRRCKQSYALVVAQLQDEYCPNCGDWYIYLNFNYEVGWCNNCAGVPRCIHCQQPLPDRHRTTCAVCRLELWLTKYADEIEYLVVVKGYNISQAKAKVVKMVRPLCMHCGRPIKGAKEGALFCKTKPSCHSAYNKYKRLLKQGLTAEQALAIIRERPITKGRLVVSNRSGTVDQRG